MDVLGLCRSSLLIFSSDFFIYFSGMFFEYFERNSLKENPPYSLILPQLFDSSVGTEHVVECGGGRSEERPLWI